MPHLQVRVVPSRAIRLLVAGILASVLVVGCAGEAFNPSGPCTTDGRAAGAYPELEALVPRRFEERAPDRVDSGRNCTAAALTTLVAHGVGELRFAGATWDRGSGSGVTIAVFESAALEAAWLAEFYETGARRARNTESVERRTVSGLGGGGGERIDALVGESYQTVLVWPDGEHIRVVLVANEIRAIKTKAAHEEVVERALGAAMTVNPRSEQRSRDGRHA